MPRSSSSQLTALSPNLTPMLDMVLQLIVFFMMLVHFGSRLEGANRGVRLPVAPAALPGANLTVDQLAAGLDARGNLLVGDQTIDPESAAAWWKRQADARRAGLELLEEPGASTPAFGESNDLPTLVVLRADRAASYGSVRKTLAEAQSRGFARFSLVVLKREEP